MTAAYGPLGSWRGPKTLKYRRLTTGRAYARPKTATYRSPATFVTAYGERGVPVRDSTLGRCGSSPYTELLEAKTNRRTPASRLDTSMFSVPVTLLS